MVYVEPKIRTPYTNLSPVTRKLCNAYKDWESTYVGNNEWAYTAYLQARWNEHNKFINVEHDIIFWPGAIEELWDCPKEWCYYPYDTGAPLFAYLGCTKISPSLMDKAPNVWIEQRRKETWVERADMPAWSWCDAWLSTSLDKLDAHMHKPGVVNANPSGWVPCSKCDKIHQTFVRCSAKQ